jgi:3-polyprenyl-4-hydroxybenzoate decarboxylase
MVRDIALVKYIVAISGASGSVYGIRLIRELLIREQEVHIIVSEPARLVIKHELGFIWIAGGRSKIQVTLRPYVLL